jgi:isocitrate dehydrogenase kinase/phosphatase
MKPLDRIARDGSATILRSFGRYRRAFRELSSRARWRFLEHDFLAGRRDAGERLVLYRRVIDHVVNELRRELGELFEDTRTWRRMKAAFAEEIAEFFDEELAETFFNSVTRRVFDTVGVDPEIEFVDLDPRRDRYGPGPSVYRTFAGYPTLRDGVREILSDGRVPAPFRDLEGDAALAAAHIAREWRRLGNSSLIEAVEVIDSAFFRGTSAYLVGRLRGDGESAPLVIALVHRSDGVVIDAVLLEEDEVSIVFSYTRAHFRALVPHPSEMIRFLRSLMPQKPIAELYISLGFSKHGKTELYRDLLGHLSRSMDRFEHAPGAAGMVMIVFTLRSFGYVFKVIRDRFAPPKTTTKADVRRRYQLVFEHDRAGRLIEAQEFEHVSFDAWRFSPELLKELREHASECVTVQGDRVAIHHLYVERKVAPLDLYVREANEDEAARAVLDYGQAIRDLAHTNIFPGDLLLKNFGLTRHGRVTFYDYDELCLVTDCRFRDLPQARTDDEEMAAEAWFHVDEHDIFPEEFLNFLGLRAELRRIFLDAHAEVLTADFWRDLQRRHLEGEVLDVFPYPPPKRLRAAN